METNSQLKCSRVPTEKEELRAGFLSVFELSTGQTDECCVNADAREPPKRLCELLDHVHRELGHGSRVLSKTVLSGKRSRTGSARICRDARSAQRVPMAHRVTYGPGVPQLENLFTRDHAFAGGHRSRQAV